MDNYKEIEYDRVWFTSDEHYGSDRHITFSGRYTFNSDIKKYNKIRREPEEIQKLLLYSVYGASAGPITSDPEINFERMKNIIANKNNGGAICNLTDVDKMCYEMIEKHNELVYEDDLVFHVGDFGHYGYAEFLNGKHVLIMGNYEYDECTKKFDGCIEEFRKYIVDNFNFIDVIENYTINIEQHNRIGFHKICKIFVTHKPSDCIYNREENDYVYGENDKNVMNLFGHIHEKCKVKRYGLNVGVDCNHFYPIAYDQVSFYLNAILNHYDENVFD